MVSYRRKSVIWLLLIAVLFLGYCLYFSVPFDRKIMTLLSVCFFCELIDSGLGMGYGTILTPVLLLIGYSPADIVPTILFSELLSGFSAVFFHHSLKNIDISFHGAHFKQASLLAVESMIGVVIGVYAAFSLPKYVIIGVIGCIIFTSGFFVVILSRRMIQYKTWKMGVLAAIAAFNKAISGGGYGPLLTSGQILSGIEGKSAVGITSYAEGFTCFVAVTMFLIKGGYINMALVVPMVAGALSSVPFSAFAISKSNEDHLKVVVGILTMVLGVLTIYKVFS